MLSRGVDRTPALLFLTPQGGAEPLAARSMTGVMDTNPTVCAASITSRDAQVAAELYPY